MAYDLAVVCYPGVEFPPGKKRYDITLNGTVLRRWWYSEESLVHEKNIISHLLSVPLSTALDQVAVAGGLAKAVYMVRIRHGE